MYSLKGFVKIKSLINNSLGAMSPVGELSTYAMTFTRAIGEYEIPDYQDLTYISMSSKRSDLGEIAVEPNHAKHILDVANNVVSFAKNSTGTILLSDLLNNLFNSFNTIQELTSGPLVNANGIRLPEYLTWRAPSLGDNRIKIWFSNEAFIRQYDEYEIMVIPPVANLNDLFADVAKSLAAIEDRTPTKVMELIQTAKGRYPETVIRAETVKFTNPNNSALQKDIVFHVIIYGAAGDNVDLIKQAIIDYCMDARNSSYTNLTNVKWRDIVPDLFKATEFILVPQWDKYAIPNRTVQAGIYSNIVSPKGILDQIKQKFNTYLPTFIDTNLQVFTHPYRSISIAAFGGIDNIGSKFKITDIFPDYSIFSTGTQDFSRLSKKTQEWSYILEEMIILAENMATNSELPPNTRITIRQNQRFIARTYDGIQYLMATKDNS